MHCFIIIEVIAFNLDVSFDREEYCCINVTPVLACNMSRVPGKQIDVASQL
jgi:hypothetical protein